MVVVRISSLTSSLTNGKMIAKLRAIEPRSPACQRMICSEKVSAGLYEELQKIRMMNDRLEIAMARPTKIQTTDNTMKEVFQYLKPTAVKPVQKKGGRERER